MPTLNTKEYYLDLAKYHMYIGAVHLGVHFYTFHKSTREFSLVDNFDWFEAHGVDRQFYHDLKFGDLK